MLEWLFAFWLLLGGNVVTSEMDHGPKERIWESGKAALGVSVGISGDPGLPKPKTGMPIRIPARKVAKYR